MAKRKAPKRELVTTLRMAMWGGIFLLVGTLVMNAMQRKEKAAVQGINVQVQPLASGHFLINKEDVPLLLERRFAHPLTDMAVGKVDVERLERVLEEDPFVLDAEAFVDAQNFVNIQLIQREPMLRVMDNNGLNYYLDADQNQMPLSEHYAARVIVVTGNIPPYEEDFYRDEDHLLSQLFDFCQLLRNDPFLHALIEQVYVNKRGEMILSPKVGKQTIRFGRYQGAEDKLERLKVFYREGLPYKGWNAYKSFDLRYEGQVVCVKR